METAMAERTRSGVVNTVEPLRGMYQPRTRTRHDEVLPIMAFDQGLFRDKHCNLEVYHQDRKWLSSQVTFIKEAWIIIHALFYATVSFLLCLLCVNLYFHHRVL